MSRGVSFTLPIGYADGKGGVHRTGIIREATTGDELELQTHERVGNNERLRDVVLFSAVVEKLGDYEPPGQEIIESLFEADFLYLQMVYREITGEGGRTGTVECPACHAVNTVRFTTLFSDARAAEDATRAPVEWGAGEAEE